MSDEIYTPFGKVLMRDEDKRPLAVSCKSCGRFALNTDTGLCCRCAMGGGLEASMDLLRRGKSVLDHLKSHISDAVDPHAAEPGKPSTRV